NKERIHAELNNKNGAIVLVCHTGNWEIMALMGGLLVARPVGTSVYAVARPLKNPYLYQYVVKLRGGMGLKTIDKSGGVRETFDKLKKENAIVCILADQRVSEGSVETIFFGRPALTTTLPVIAALRLGTPIFYNFLSRTKDLRYEMQVEGPIEIVRTGDFRTDIQANTQKFVSRIEAEIRKDPARWLWMHHRWRVPHGPKD
ncbi:MAG: lysophospholipid acyltransferase family protein, partial [Candidatus Omnitrophica bacterium]|nr:lysophospholipid acyltransferase family protein [Candidatus Omnitrophota bacterium]